MGGFGLILKAGLISLLWLPTAHVSGETVTVHQTLNISDSCSFPNPLKVKVIRDKEDDVTLSLITNRIIHVPQRVVLMRAEEVTEETIYESVEIPQSNVAYHNYDNVACFVAHCIKHKDSNVAFYTINGTLLIHGDMFHLYPERTEARFGSHDVTQDYVMEPVSGGSGDFDYVAIPDSDRLKLNLATRMKRNTGSTQDATEYFIDVLPVVDYYLYTRWLSRSNNDQTQALSAITSYMTNIFTGIALRCTTLRLTDQKQLTVLMLTPYISTDASTSRFTEDHKTDLGDGVHSVEVFQLLKSFGDWVKANNEIPHHDHATLFTGYEKYYDSRNPSRGVIGAGYVGTACAKTSGTAVSIVKDRMGYQTERSATRQLGHSLGAKSDGTHNLCSASDQYIMSVPQPYQRNDHNMHNVFKFSSCSSDEISSYISRVELTTYLDTCLLASSGTTLPDTPPTPHHIHQLCPSQYGNGSSLCWGGSEYPLTATYVCTIMFCEDDEGQCHHVIPPSGTCCGNGKFCVQGMCTPAPAGECVLDDKCPFNDQPSCETKIGSDMSKCFDKLADTYCCDRCKDRMDYAQVPEYPPVIVLTDPSQSLDFSTTINGTDNQVVTLGLKAFITVSCFVDGGVPTVSSVTLHCAASGQSNITRSGPSLDYFLMFGEVYNNTECVCSATHVTGLYNRTTSFVINLMAFFPRDPPKMYVDYLPVVNGQDSTLTWGVSYDVMCKVLGGAPRVSSVSIACDGFDVQTDPSYRATMRDVLASPDINNTKCVCSADHYTGQYILTTSIILVVIADVPPNPPVLTVNLETVTSLEIVYGNTIGVRCFVNGGNPSVRSVSLICGGRLIDNVPGYYLYHSFRVLTSLHQQECVCSADHVTGLYSKTASFTVLVTYIIPDDPPIIVVNGDELFPNQIVTYDFNKTLNMECSVNGGTPEVHQVNISCGGIDVGQSLGDSIRAAFDVTSDFDQAECVCLADHISGRYNLTTSMIIDIREIPPQDDPKLTLDGGSPITDNDDIRVRLADTLDIICVVDGGYPDVANVTVSCTGTMDNMTDPGTSLIRQVVVTRDLDQARCLCTAYHVTGKYWNTTSFSVHVLDPPSLTGFTIDSKSDPSHDIEVTAGERIVFMCQAYGMPAPEVNITREPIGRRLRGVTSPSNSDAYTNVFTGESIISCTDRGQYRCLAGNKIDDVVYKYLSIRVLCPPYMDETAAAMQVARLGAMGLADISLKVKSYPEVTDFRLSKHKRRELYEPNVPFVRDFDSSEYMTRVNYDDLVNEVTLSLFDPDPCQDCFYTLTLINGVEPSLNVSFNATFASDVTGTKQGVVSAVGSGVGMYAVSAVAGLVIVMLVIGMAVYVKVCRRDTSFISKG